MTRSKPPSVAVPHDAPCVAHPRPVATGILERVFSAAFRGLVYPQIWEDPLVDMEALALKPTDTMVTIASGSCNVMSYLTANPAEIIAVDLSPAHVALGKLKLAAATHLPDHTSFSNLFRHANLKSNTALYERHIRPHLDAKTRKYWDGREANGRRRISRFSRGFYGTGLLGRFISAAHVISKIYGIDPRKLLRHAHAVEEAHGILDPACPRSYDSRSSKALTSIRASLFGYGHSARPVRGARLVTCRMAMIGATAQPNRAPRLRLPLKDNYIAWQALRPRLPARARLPAADPISRPAISRPCPHPPRSPS